MKEKYSIEKSIGFYIYRTALIIKSTLQRSLKERGFDITAEQWGILRVLWEEEGLSQKEVGDRLFKDKPNVTRIVDAMERKGMLFRQPVHNDRRKYSLYLTRDGKKLQAELLPIAQEILKKATNSLNNNELESLKNLLNVIYGNLS